MLTGRGYFNPAWLAVQTTERLRYEARCEKVRGWDSLHRSSLTLILRQTQVTGCTV